MTKLEMKRREKGLSRQQLAVKVGVTYESIGNYENKQREPKASILKKLAEALDCKMEDLI